MIETRKSEKNVGSTPVIVLRKTIRATEFWGGGYSVKIETDKKVFFTFLISIFSWRAL